MSKAKNNKLTCSPKKRQHRRATTTLVCWGTEFSNKYGLCPVGSETALAASDARPRAQLTS
eukprot:3684671-Amphidinium_carterae.1